MSTILKKLEFVIAFTFTQIFRCIWSILGLFLIPVAILGAFLPYKTYDKIMSFFLNYGKATNKTGTGHDQQYNPSNKKFSNIERSLRRKDKHARPV